MANTSTIVCITHTDTLDLNGRDDKQAVLLLRNHLSGLASGAKRGTEVAIYPNGTAAAKASGTFTLSSAVATNTASINGVTLVADTDFDVGADDDETAANLADAINASTDALIDGIVTAAASGAVVTITAAMPGKAGNCITIEGTSPGTTLVASGARLTGGAGGDATAVTISL